MATAELGAQSDEALSDGSPSRQLGGISGEALTDSAAAPSRQLGAISGEALTDSASPPKRELAALSVEVLVPRKMTFAGWGTPIVNSPGWS